MRILQVSPSFYPAKSFGGPVTTLLNLCNALSKFGTINLRVLTTNTLGRKRRERMTKATNVVRFEGRYDVYYAQKVSGVAFSPLLLMRLPGMMRWADAIHLTGVYSFSTIPTLLLSRIYRKPILWSVRGSLMEWEGKRKRRLKKVWNLICNALCVKQKVALHITSALEKEQSSKVIDRATPILVGHGIDIPRNHLIRQWMPDGFLRVLFLGRLHPIKALEGLLQAVALVRNPISLTIAGSGQDEYTRKLKMLVGDLSMDEKVQFIGMVDDARREKEFNKSDVLVLPSHSENFGIVVAESLAHGIPVITSKGTPWMDVEKYGCGWWVDNSPESLARALGMASHANLETMGRKGRMWMEKDFSWDAIAGKYIEVYQSLLNGTIEQFAVGSSV